MKEEVEVVQTKVPPLCYVSESDPSLFLSGVHEGHQAAAVAEAVHLPCKQFLTHLHKSQAR